MSRRRALVLVDESARHPFLASLPPHVRCSEPPTPAPDRASWWREFLMAYCACFLAVFSFIV